MEQTHVANNNQSVIQQQQTFAHVLNVDISRLFTFDVYRSKSKH